MKTIQFRVPYEVREKILKMIDNAEDMRKKGYVDPSSFFRLLNGLYALDSMCQRLDDAWWDNMDVKSEMKDERV